VWEPMACEDCPHARDQGGAGGGARGAVRTRARRR
jgi:hypothetical protein